MQDSDKGDPGGGHGNHDPVGPGSNSPNTPTEQSKAPGAVKAGLSFGSALAITISWSLNKSVVWAIIHGLMSWAYVIYYILFKEPPGQ